MKEKISNFFKRLIRKICEWNIIMSKTTLASLDLMDGLKDLNKKFKDKVDNPVNNNEAK